MYKFGNGRTDDRQSIYPRYPRAWALERTLDTERLVVAPDSNQIGLLVDVLDLMPESIWVMYVLVVPRGEGEPGRYQSPEPLSRAQVKQFLFEYREFLEKDGRHSIWLRAVNGEGQIVYDRHDLIYVYGMSIELIPILLRHGLSEVQRDSIVIPDPHSHHYHAEFDLDASRLIGAFKWHCTALREQDLQ